MKLYSMKLYHGTTADFDSFDTEHMSSGEGAQIHGWGLYFAADKEIVTKRYTDRLAKRNGINWLTYTDDERTIKFEWNNKPSFIGEWKEKFDKWCSENNIQVSELMEDQLSFNTVEEIRTDAEDQKEKWIKMVEAGKGDWEVYSRYSGSTDVKNGLQSVYRFLQELTHWKSGFSKANPSVYTVEIPDDLLIVPETNMNSISDILEKWLNEYYSGFKLWDKFKERLQDDYRWYDSLCYVIYFLSPERDKLSEFADTKRFVSLELEKRGVNGIVYDGEIDGQCYVIFNPQHISIISKENT